MTAYSIHLSHTHNTHTQTRLQYAKGDEPPSELFKDLYDGVWPALIVGTPAGKLGGVL